MTARVLVVEKDASSRGILTETLAREGFQVDVATCASEAVAKVTEVAPELVLLNVALPDESGIDTCRKMNRLTDAPVVVMGTEDDEGETVASREAGAAGCVTHPLRLHELVARLRAVLRRHRGPRPSLGGRDSGPAAPGLGVVRMGPLEVDVAARRLFVDGDPVHLSKREFDILGVLASPPGRVNRREELMDRLWWDSSLPDTRTLDTHIRRLRVKIEPDPSQPRYLVTVKGVGFRLDDVPADRGQGRRRQGS